MSMNTRLGNGMARRAVLRGAALGGAGIAAGTLLPAPSAFAAQGGDGLVFPGVDVVIDASHATQEVAILVKNYLAHKSEHDPAATMTYFAHSPLTYIDGVLGWSWYSWDSLLSALETFMPNWPTDGKSYPTTVLGDTDSAIVFFTDTEGLFGPSEIRAIGVVDFRDRKIVRQIDYWDGRHFGIADTDSLKVSANQFPADFRESTVGENAAPMMKTVVNALAKALGNSDGTSAAALFAPGAVFADSPAHVEITGPRSIGSYLIDAAAVLPYVGAGTSVRHIVGSALGGGYEWINEDGPVPRGVTALELDCWGKITRLTAMWDGSLVDDATLDLLSQKAVER